MESLPSSVLVTGPNIRMAWGASGPLSSMLSMAPVTDSTTVSATVVSSFVASLLSCVAAVVPALALEAHPPTPSTTAAQIPAAYNRYFLNIIFSFS